MRIRLILLGASKWKQSMLCIFLALAGAVLFTTCQEACAQICRPVAERTGEVGCWIIANQPIGQLTKSQTFWHLDAYPTEVEAVAAKASRSAVVKSLGKTWLLTIADEGWRPVGGERIAEIGPLPISAGQTYSAQYMEQSLRRAWKLRRTPMQDRRLGTP
jgi:hypothetical protein